MLLLHQVLKYSNTQVLNHSKRSGEVVYPHNVKNDVEEAEPKWVLVEVLKHTHTLATSPGERALLQR